MSGRFLTAVLAVAALAAPVLSRGQSTSESPSRGSSPTEVTSTSRPVRLIRSWQDSAKGPNGIETPRRVEVVFDYQRGIGYQNSYTLGGIQTGRLALGLGHPAPSPVEIDEAFDVVRGDPEFGKILKGSRAVFEGGFLLTEARGPCGPGSRCLRVFVLSSDRSRTLRQVVVDLVSVRVVDGNYSPGSTRTGK